MIQVPEYLSAGEKIRIHIEERRYMAAQINFLPLADDKGQLVF